MTIILHGQENNYINIYTYFGNEIRRNIYSNHTDKNKTKYALSKISPN